MMQKKRVIRPLSLLYAKTLITTQVAPQRCPALLLEKKPLFVVFFEFFSKF